MMKLKLIRRRSSAKHTLGKLYDEGGRFLCYSLEDVVREVAGQPVAQWKVKGETAIPSGVYRLTLERSPRFGPDTMTLHDVPGFVGVRIHAGNTDADTEGCPLLGLAVDAGGIVAGSSRPAVLLVRELVAAAGGEAELEIVNGMDA